MPIVDEGGNVYDRNGKPKPKNTVPAEKTKLLWAMHNAYNDYKDAKKKFESTYWRIISTYQDPRPSGGILRYFKPQAVQSTRDNGRTYIEYEISQADYDWYQANKKPNTDAFIVWNFGEKSKLNIPITTPTTRFNSGDQSHYIREPSSVTESAITCPKGAWLALVTNTSAPAWKLYKDMIKKLKLWQAAKQKYDKYVADNKPPASTTGGTTGDTLPSGTVFSYNTTDLKYNLGAVNYTYLRDHSFKIDKKGELGMQYYRGGNAPILRVKNAQEAFSGYHINDKGSYVVDNSKQQKASKGIIQQRSKHQADTSGSTVMTPKQADAKGKAFNEYRMGFQFHYNPSSFAIGWSGAPPVDTGFILSDKSTYAPIGAGMSTGSGFSVTVPLNRMADMQFVGMDEKDWKNITWSSVYGVSLKEQISTKALSQTPTFDDLRAIRDLGTMYDVEFLLQTILGYRFKSGLRLQGHALTADLGYLGGAPVEVHLGKNMRYIASITGVSVSHSVFTKDMVPILSSLEIQCARLPDYLYNTGGAEDNKK